MSPDERRCPKCGRPCYTTGYLPGQLFCQGCRVHFTPNPADQAPPNTVHALPETVRPSPLFQAFLDAIIAKMAGHFILSSQPEHVRNLPGSPVGFQVDLAKECDEGQRLLEIVVTEAHYQTLILQHLRRNEPAP